MQTSGGFFTQIGAWIGNLANDTWVWFNQLNYQEWFVVLGIGAAAGFMCMRGYGSRSSY